MASVEPFKKKMAPLFSKTAPGCSHFGSTFFSAVLSYQQKIYLLHDCTESCLSETEGNGLPVTRLLTVSSAYQS